MCLCVMGKLAGYLQKVGTDARAAGGFGFQFETIKRLIRHHYAYIFHNTLQTGKKRQWVHLTCNNYQMQLI